jgi:P-type conjugative transfer protein TrbG
VNNWSALGPVASGDTVRWMIGDTVSGSGPASRVHILVKPIRPDIATNLVINTDRRTYHLELRANPSVYMASVSWTYPQDELIALRQARTEAIGAAPVAAGIDLSTLNFRYAIDGDRPDWRPLRAFDDGVRVFIEFPESIAQGELPPLFVIGAKGEAELVNYRVAGRYMIVDRLFAKRRTAAWRAQGSADSPDHLQPAGAGMNGEDQTERPEAETADPDSAVKLRGDPPRVMRLSRKAIGIASACGFALVGGAMIYALQPVGRKGAEELYNTDGVAVADNLCGRAQGLRPGTQARPAASRRSRQADP